MVKRTLEWLLVPVHVLKAMKNHARMVKLEDEKARAESTNMNGHPMRDRDTTELDERHTHSRHIPVDREVAAMHSGRSIHMVGGSTLRCRHIIHKNHKCGK